MAERRGFPGLRSQSLASSVCSRFLRRQSEAEQGKGSKICHGQCFMAEGSLDVMTRLKRVRPGLQGVALIVTHSSRKSLTDSLLKSWQKLNRRGNSSGFLPSFLLTHLLETVSGRALWKRIFEEKLGS